MCCNIQLVVMDLLSSTGEIRNVKHAMPKDIRIKGEICQNLSLFSIQGASGAQMASAVLPDTSIIHMLQRMKDANILQEQRSSFPSYTVHTVIVYVRSYV